MRIGTVAARAGAAVALAGALLGAAPARGEPAPAFPDARARAWQTGLLRTDRLHHFTISVSLGIGIGIAAGDGAAGAGGALALGLAKEISDSRRRGFDAVDLAADALGATLGGLVVAGLVR